MWMSYNVQYDGKLNFKVGMIYIHRVRNRDRDRYGELVWHDEKGSV